MSLLPVSRPARTLTIEKSPQAVAVSDGREIYARTCERLTGRGREVLSRENGRELDKDSQQTQHTFT